MEYLEKIKILKASSTNEYIYNVFNRFILKIKIRDNPYSIPLDVLFSIAERKNKKRAFLFVSKVLGKHIPVSPFVPLLAGVSLAYRYMEAIYGTKDDKIDEIIDTLVSQKNYKYIYDKISQKQFYTKDKLIFIGFAETATALGHSMYDCFSNAKFIHTTREEIDNLKAVINFEEEHSHATSHRCYSLDKELLNSKNTIVLVDDEITTGKTTLNIIEAIQKKYPRKEYVIVSLLDWRTEEHINNFRLKEKELGVTIREISLISGNIEVENCKCSDGIIYDKLENIELNSSKDINIEYIYIHDFFINSINFNENSYLLETGRFGIDSEYKSKIDKLVFDIGSKLSKTRKGKKTLCLGTGEFIYLPMRISSYMGEGILYHSTTRSPIYSYNCEDYGAKNVFSFLNYEDDSIVNYIYNISYGYYDDVYLFIEKDIEKEKLKPLIEIFKSRGILNISVVICTKNKES